MSEFLPKYSPEHPRTKLRPLEFHVFRRLKEDLQGQSILIACSGGRDSIVLARVLLALRDRLQLNLAIAHVHHGLAVSLEQKNARDEAHAFVGRFAREWQLPLFSVVAEGLKAPLRSEAELREFRLKALEEMRVQSSSRYLAFAHHAEDLLETRLIRLIRGTGGQGIVAMKEKTSRVLRPLLEVSQEEMSAYLCSLSDSSSEGMKWVEDPSNQSTEPLRNWIRHFWLNELEKKRPGSRRSLRLSLEQLAQTIALAPSYEETFLENGRAIDRKLYAGLEDIEQCRLIAAYLRTVSPLNFESSHIAEIQKRLTTEKKVFTFVLLKLRWQVNAEQIHADPV